MGSEVSQRVKNSSDEAPSEQERIEGWRRQEFYRLLVPEVPADDIEPLVKSDADLGEARALKDAGCPSDLIVKILAP